MRGSAFLTRNDSASQRSRRRAARTPIKLAATVAAAGLAVSACGTMKMGAAAITGNSRITTGNLTGQVANLNSAYRTDQAKGIKPQRSTGQEAQQVLSWLITFKIYDKLAKQHGIAVTPADTDKQLSALTAEAKSSGMTLQQYVSAAGAVPPDLLPQLGQYFAILTALEYRLDGGKTPTSSSGQTALESKVGHDQCLAAKSLGISVNPQYGQFDYSTYAVVSKPPTLAADPSPTPKTSPAVTSPPC
jgi:hypothetical protein